MGSPKEPHLHKFIPSSTFETCLVSGWKRIDILRKYRKRENGVYYLDKFINHLKNECNLTFKEYVKNWLKEEWPKCPINSEEVGFMVCGKGVYFSRFVATVTKEHSPAFKAACDKMAKDRLGEGNPMYGKPAWNRDIPDDHPWKIEFIKRVTGHIKSPETIEKLKLAAKNRTKEPHLGCKHSEETKQKLREANAKKWANGVFNRKTSIEVKTENFLKEISPFLRDKNWVFQHCEKYYTLDFAFPDSKIGIECQGTFFHTDPRVYPNGPITAIQRRNAGRDKSKRKYLTERGWQIIELWEIEINDGRFKEQLLCELQKLGLIENSGQEHV